MVNRIGGAEVAGMGYRQFAGEMVSKEVLMTPRRNDILVYKGKDLNRRFFDGSVESVSQFNDPSGIGEWVNIRFTHGGQVSIYTEKPIVFIEPECS